MTIADFMFLTGLLGVAGALICMLLPTNYNELQNDIVMAIGLVGMGLAFVCLPAAGILYVLGY